MLIGHFCSTRKALSGQGHLVVGETLPGYTPSEVSNPLAPTLRAASAISSSHVMNDDGVPAKREKDKEKKDKKEKKHKKHRDERHRHGGDERSTHEEERRRR